jgi:nucleotide-binding universal stress UspA family protein
VGADNAFSYKEARSKEDKMSMFPTKILLATDGSEEATLAAHTAVDLADKTNSELHVIYVGWLDYGYPSYVIPDPEYMQQLQEKLAQEARKLLDAEVERAKAAGANVVEAHLSMGSPDAEIVKLAEEIGAGLIVMGSRGLGGIRRALIGSVSDSVVRHAHCPVLVARAGGNGQVTPSSQRILLATDGSKEATLATQTVTEIATKTGSELHLVHVSVPPYHPSYEGVYTGDYLQEEEAELEREAQELLNEQVKRVEAAGGSVAQAHPRVGRPESEITDLAEEIGARLIILGSRGLGVMRRVLMGSVSESVVHHAHCSVLVVRKEEPEEEARSEEVGLV